MADLKLSDLLAATNLSEDTFFYGIQGGVSKKIASNVILRNLTDPIIKGRLVLDGVQLLRGTDANQTIAMDKSRTEFSVGSLVVYPTLPNANVDGMVKVITLANVQGGRVELTTANSNILPNVSVTFQKPGESILLVYSANSYSNGWTILGTTPSLVTSLELPEANVSDARIRRAISAGDVTIDYDQANGKIRVGDLSNVVAKVSLANVTTDDLREGNVNLYFTNARAVAALQPDLNQLRKKNANIMYVSTNGDDSLDGLTMPNAIANIHIALARIAGNVAYGDGTNVNWTVKVFPGRYTLYNNPVTIPRETSLIGHDLRSTDIYPENETADMFYLNNGIYVNGFTFRGHRAANPANVRAGAAVFSYNPNKSAGNITTSPYIQNCSSITTNGTGMRIDGNYVGGLKSAVLDAFTQFNVGGIGIHLVNGGYMQLVSLFTICCAYSVLAESGGFCSVTNSNSSFGEYGLVADGVGPTNYSGNVTRQVSSRSVEIEFNTRGNSSIRSTPPNIQDKAIMANYNQAKCFRDTGLIVDSLAFDLAYNSNIQSRFSGLQYATQGISLVEDQKVELDRTFRYFKTLCTNVIVNSTSWDFDANTPYQGANTQVIIAGAPSNSEIANVAIDSIDQFLDIYNNGVFGVTDAIIPHKYPANVIASRQNAANLLVANKNFIRSEVAAYFANVYPYATYIPNRSLFDDIGYMVDSLAFDISHEGNRQMIMRAILMWDYLTEGDISVITNQIPQTSAAFAYIKTIIDEILTLQNVSPIYQTTYSQNTSFASGVSTNEISYVRNRIDDITSIIEGGATYQNVKDNITSIPLTANTDPNVVLATQIILSNRDFIRAEVLEYVNQNWMNISNGTRNFYTVGEVTNVSSNTCIVTFDEKILFIDRPVANTRVSFHNGSYISTSGHTFEYVGAGANLANALPFNGGIPVQENEVVETRGGAVYYTSTDHKGDFRIGNELLINRATGTINGRTFNKSLFAVMTPYILALQ